MQKRSPVYSLVIKWVNHEVTHCRVKAVAWREKQGFGNRLMGLCFQVGFDPGDLDSLRVSKMLYSRLV